jgi:hypothetical protein
MMVHSSRESRLGMAPKVTEHTSRGSRLRALDRLLNYALAESKELGLAALDRLLGAAATAVSDEIDNIKVLSPKTEASRERPPPKS